MHLLGLTIHGCGRRLLIDFSKAFDIIDHA